MRTKFTFTLIAGLMFSISLFAQTNTDNSEVGIEENLGAYLPLDLKFVNSKNDTVALKEIIDKPTLLALVYYECPGICNPLLTELAWVVSKVDLEPIDDFKVIALSFDHEETPEIAARWKKNYFDGMKNPFPEDAWYFLTGDSASIKALTDSVGFYFNPVDNEFVHAGSVVAISQEGMISRYLFGTSYNPFDIKMALLEAESGKTNATITKILQFCFSYDPEGRTYVLDITRIAGVIILTLIGGFFILLVIKKKKVKKNEGAIING